MATVAQGGLGGKVPPQEQGGSGGDRPPEAAQSRRRSFPVWRWLIFLFSAAYFLIPLYAALRFAGLKAFPDVFKQAGFSAAILLSLRLAVVTTILTLVLMVPTTIYVHLRLPRVRRTMEGITILPIVIPPIVLIIGVLKVAPGPLLSTPYLLALVYVILAMPFAYRSLDAGLRSVDLKTLVEASNSLGAGWPITLWRVVLPNIRTSVLSATVLTVALVLGEFTMASLALFVTFPVWIVQFEQNSGPVSVAASLLALFVTWILLMLIVTVGDRTARKRGGAQVNLFTVAPQETRPNAGEPE
jgi:putative spermidine/putrescine transport system permease protein